MTTPFNFDHAVPPRLPYAVIDQNCLRDEAIVATAISHAQKGRLILLHDIAAVEMTKSKEWESTLLRSLKILANYPEGVVLTHATGVLMRKECASGEPMFDFVDHEATPSFRQCLRDIAAGSGSTLDAVRASIPVAKSIADNQQLNTAQNKRMLLSMVEVWKGELTADQLKSLRNGDDALFRSLLSEKKMIVKIANGLENAEYPKETTFCLAALPSVSAHNYLCMAANGLYWLVQGGIESLTDEKFTNDLCDMDYLVAASSARI